MGLNRAHRGCKCVEPYFYIGVHQFGRASIGWLPNFTGMSTLELVIMLHECNAVKEERDEEFIQAILEEITERNK